MRKSKVIISFLLCISMLISSFTLNVGAEDVSTDPVSEFVGFADFLLSFRDTAVGAMNELASLFDSDVCQASTVEFGKHNFVPRVTQINGQVGTYYVCEYCDKYAGDAFNVAYDTYVNDLPAIGLDSDGYLYWVPNFTYGRLSAYTFCYLFGDESAIADSGYTSKPLSGCDFSFDYFDSGVHLSFAGNPGSFSFGNPSLSLSYSGICPISGYYERPYELSGSYYSIRSNGDKSPVVNLNSRYGVYSASYYAAGAKFSNYAQTGLSYLNDMSLCDIRFNFPIVRIKPSSGLIDPVGDTTYNINSRPAFITGDYGIIGDNGTIIKVDNNTIVNETNNTVYNPVTNTTYDMSGWTYDYSTRTYNITTIEDNSVTVTYGDEYVTINEGDTVYNIYYIVEDTSQDCTHDWQQTSCVDPDCITPGQITYTCSLCQETKTESVPALGHAWALQETVEDEYDEEGNVIVQGYDLYVCSRCGEIYKDLDGTGPPAPVDPDKPSDAIGWLDRIYQKLCDILEVITGLDLSPEINVDVEVDADGEETQESWFSKLLSKFSFVSSVHDIYSQLVADVTSDAETAYLLSDGSINADEVTAEHAAVYRGDGFVSYTAPELAISFGASDKYGVDWENIKAIDLSWYASYKPTVDNIVSGILWLTYVFLLIKRLPGIIRGWAMVSEDCIKIDDFRWYNGL